MLGIHIMNKLYNELSVLSHQSTTKYFCQNPFKTLEELLPQKITLKYDASIKNIELKARLKEMQKCSYKTSCIMGDVKVTL